MSEPGHAASARPLPPRAVRVGAFAGWYLLRFLRANYVVAKEIVTPGDGLRPAIVELPLRCRTPAEISAFMSLISLTPGTLALLLRADHSSLVVHGMHAGDPGAFVDDLLDFERRLLAAWRAEGPPRGHADDDPAPRR